MNSIIIFSAKYLFLAIIVIIGFIFFKLPKPQKKEMIILALITLPITFIISRLVGKVFYNPRPFVVENFIPLIAHSSDNGFPSDHTLLSSALALLIYFFNKKLGILSLLIAVIVGSARVLAGVHHLADIIGSLVISSMVFIPTTLFYSQYIKSRLAK